VTASRPHPNLGVKLRAVLDTNIFVSGLFGRGSLTAALQDFWIADAFVLLTSPAILREVAQVLYSPAIQHRFHPRAATLRRFFHSLLLDSGVLAEQQLNEGTKQRFASLADVVNKLEKT
jgi:putative PIN family toxin of toxin-antitoxin system